MRSAIQGLNALNARLAKELQLLELPGKPWVPTCTHKGERVKDVIFIGAGMCGLAGAAQLKLSGVPNIVLYDTAEAGKEGPWESFARMKTLRSPKTLAGPSLGIPSLTFRAWFEAQYGEEAFERMQKIPKGKWMDYLRWYRKILDLPVVNNTRLTGISDPGEGRVAVALEDRSGSRLEYCRHLVLATGRSGLGGAFVPAFLKGIDRRFWAHSAEDIAFEKLKGKRVVVIGAGASAMDNAGSALEAGAASLDILVRRKEMPRINKMTGISSQGVVHGMRKLPDAWKYRFNDYVSSAQVPPPRSSVLRVTRHANARIFLACPVTDISSRDQLLRITTPHQIFEADFVIAATGFRNDFVGREEFAAIEPHIRTWSDKVYESDMGSDRAFLTNAPYLGDAFEFQEKRPGCCKMLSRIHCFNDAAMLSHGKLSGDIPAISAGAQRLMRGIVAEMFAADVAQHFETLQSYDIPELLGDEWVDATADIPNRHGPEQAAREQRTIKQATVKRDHDDSCH